MIGHKNYKNNNTIKNLSTEQLIEVITDIILHHTQINKLGSIMPV